MYRLERRGQISDETQHEGTLRPAAATDATGWNDAPSGRERRRFAGDERRRGSCDACDLPDRPKRSAKLLAACRSTISTTCRQPHRYQPRSQLHRSRLLVAWNHPARRIALARWAVAPRWVRDATDVAGVQPSDDAAAPSWPPLPVDSLPRPQACRLRRPCAGPAAPSASHDGSTTTGTIPVAVVRPRSGSKSNVSGHRSSITRVSISAMKSSRVAIGDKPRRSVGDARRW